MKNDGDTENTLWEPKIKYYKELIGEELKITGLTLDTDKSIAKTEDYTNIKKICREIKDKKNHEEGFESILEKFKIWCANSN